VKSIMACYLESQATPGREPAERLQGYARQLFLAGQAARARRAEDEFRRRRELWDELLSLFRRHHGEAAQYLSPDQSSLSEREAVLVLALPGCRPVQTRYVRSAQAWLQDPWCADPKRTWAVLPEPAAPQESWAYADDLAEAVYLAAAWQERPRPSVRFRPESPLSADLAVRHAFGALIHCLSDYLDGRIRLHLARHAGKEPASAPPEVPLECDRPGEPSAAANHSSPQSAGLAHRNGSGTRSSAGN
jgi:hypothetical protein